MITDKLDKEIQKKHNETKSLEESKRAKKSKLMNILKRGNRKKNKGLLIVLAILCLVFMSVTFVILDKLRIAKAANPNPTYCDGTTDGSGVYNCVITVGTYSSPFVLPASTSPNSLDGTNLTITKDVTSGQSAYVVSTGAHRFNNVTMEYNSRVTSPDLASTSNSMADEPEKIIDWTIEKTLSLSDYSTIRVDRKGYWGAVIPGEASGPGHGQSISLPGTVTNCAGGGGGLGGNGQNGSGQDTPPTIASGGVYSGVNIDTIDRGSGGGSATCRNTSRSGGAGGGVIKIWAKEKIVQFGNSEISAGGGTAADMTVSGGGGAGGYIWIKTKTFSSSNNNAGLLGPIIRGGSGGTTYAPSGLTNVAPDMAFNFISAYGGSASGTSYGGAGGGGIVKIYTETAEIGCNIKNGTDIPSRCEGKDVVINGSASTDPNYPLIIYTTNSFQHHFKSLKITNNAVLTHESLSFPMDFNTAAPYALTPFGEAKKVDLLIDGDLTLESGGKIDVSGKGYPGGMAFYMRGCTGTSLVTTEWAGSGYGPGRGSPITHCERHNDGSVAGGAGYGGTGGAGRSNHGESALGGISYPITYLPDFSSDEFLFGSGGGAAVNEDAGYSSYASGGAGGGRVSIQALNISFVDPNSYIVANGNQGQYSQDESGPAYGGGGSGGTIWLKSSNINGQFSPQATGAGEGHGGSIDGDSGRQINLKANGNSSGMAAFTFGGGGGGRIAIGPGSGSTVTITLKKEEPDGTFSSAGNIPINVCKSDNTSCTVETPPLGIATFTLGNGDYYTTATASGYKDALTNFTVFNLNQSVILILHLNPMITGDVGSKFNIYLKKFQVQDKSIIAGDSITNLPEPCADTTACKKLSGYTLNFTKNKTLLQKNIDNLINKATSVEHGILEGSGTWNLNSDDITNQLSPPKNPEGGVWIVGSTTSPQDLSIADPTNFMNRGTIIVTGHLKIDANLTPLAVGTSADAKNSQIGFIVLGKPIGVPNNSLIITNNTTSLPAAIYVDDNGVSNSAINSINFNTRTQKLTFNGFLVARNNIVLPSTAAGSQLIYNPYINPNPPKVALPGFGVLQASILKRTELAP